MKNLVQIVVVLVSTGLGTLAGRYALVPALALLIPHLTWLLPQSGPPKHDFGDMISVIMTTGYSLGLAIGVGMTGAVLGGLLAGIALARRVSLPGAPAVSAGRRNSPASL